MAGYDPGLSMAWTVAATISNNEDRDFVKGISQFDRAIENDPANTTALLWRGIDVSGMGFIDEAIDDMSQCIEIDPAYLNCYRHLSRLYAINGDIDKALDTYFVNLQNGLTINDFWLIHTLLNAGKEYAATLLLISEADGDRAYPYKDIMHAVRNPSMDHSAAILKMDQWVALRGVDPKWRMGEWMLLGVYDRIVKNPDLNQAWLPVGAGYRVSPEYKTMVKDMGWLKYWQQNSFPPQCRPLGEDSFECD